MGQYSRPEHTLLTLKLVPKMSIRWSRTSPTSFERAPSMFVLRSTSALSGVMEVKGPRRLDSALVEGEAEETERERVSE